MRCAERKKISRVCSMRGAPSGCTYILVVVIAIALGDEDKSHPCRTKCLAEGIRAASVRRPAEAISLMSPLAIRTASLCAALIICNSGSAAAQTERCAWLRPSITVDQAPVAEPVVDDTLSREQITALRAARGAPLRPELTFGYSETSTATEYGFEVQSFVLPSGALCLGIKTLLVRFSLQKRRILIARELANRPCLLAHVAHQTRKHAMLDAHLVDKFTDVARNHFEQAWSSGPGVETRDASAGLDEIKRQIQARLDEVETRFARERDEGKDAIDAEDLALDVLPAACREERRELLGLGP